MQNWDFFGTKFGLWSHLGPSPKFGTSLEGLNRHLYDNKLEIDGKWGAAADLVFNFQHLSHSAL